MKSDKLESLRYSLDETDAELVRLLRHRFELCEEIAAVKQECGIPMMQPERIARVIDKVGRLAEQNAINPDFVRELFQSIIKEACQVETRLMLNRHGTELKASE
jgi:4-amino-4-deoxychorismate mutase